MMIIYASILKKLHFEDSPRFFSTSLARNNWGMAKEQTMANILLHWNNGASQSMRYVHVRRQREEEEEEEKRKRGVEREVPEKRGRGREREGFCFEMEGIGGCRRWTEKWIDRIEERRERKRDFDLSEEKEKWKKENG